MSIFFLGGDLNDCLAEPVQVDSRAGGWHAYYFSAVFMVRISLIELIMR